MPWTKSCTGLHRSAPLGTRRTVSVSLRACPLPCPAVRRDQPPRRADARRCHPSAGCRGGLGDLGVRAARLPDPAARHSTHADGRPPERRARLGGSDRRRPAPRTRRRPRRSAERDRGRPRRRRLLDGVPARRRDAAGGEPERRRAGGDARRRARHPEPRHRARRSERHRRRLLQPGWPRRRRHARLLRAGGIGDQRTVPAESRRRSGSSTLGRTTRCGWRTRPGRSACPARRAPPPSC